MVQASPEQALHVWSQSSGKNLLNLSPLLCYMHMRVCGLLTSRAAAGKTSEHSSKQQNTDEDKAVLFLYDKSVFERVLPSKKRARGFCVYDRGR